MTDQLVKDNERIDDLQNGYYVIQDPDKFCFGMDAVLLSGFAKVKKGETALDLGTGTGIIPILLKTKTNGKHFTGLEIQKECADMAGRSVRYNHLEDDVEIFFKILFFRYKWTFTHYLFIRNHNTCSVL